MSGRVERLADYIYGILGEFESLPLRSGIEETPKRAATAIEYWLGGYNIDPANILKCFEDGADKYDEMVVVTNIEFYSKCEHHFADIHGRATVAYIPNKRIVGLSKLARVVDAYARRLQVQERMTQQIAHCIQNVLKPLGVGVHIMARHSCMESRGIRAHGSVTHTATLLGAMRNEPETRAEFLSYINKDQAL